MSINIQINDEPYDISEEQFKKLLNYCVDSTIVRDDEKTMYEDNYRLCHNDKIYYLETNDEVDDMLNGLKNKLYVTSELIEELIDKSKQDVLFNLWLDVLQNRNEVFDKKFHKKIIDAGYRTSNAKMLYHYVKYNLDKNIDIDFIEYIINFMTYEFDNESEDLDALHCIQEKLDELKVDYNVIENFEHFKNVEYQKTSFDTLYK